MRYELWSDGVLAGEFSSPDDGHAIVRGYRMAAGMGMTIYAKLYAKMNGAPRYHLLAVYMRGEKGCGYRPDIPGIASMPPEALDVINGCSNLRRRLVEEIVEHGEVIESEYMDGAHDRKAAQKVLYKGKVFAFTVACGCRQFAAADPKDVHRLGIPQDLRRVVPRAGRAGE